MKTGKFILVTGYFAAGKSSLVGEAINKIPNLIYLKTVTTRPKRESEESTEYSFVTSEDYSILRNKSEKWDHSEIASNYYGADVSRYNELLLEGKNVICCVAPDAKIIDQMINLYAVKPILIWIETDLIIANKRLSESRIDGRVARKDHDLQTQKNASEIKTKADKIFKPKCNLKEDQITFTTLIKKLLK